jgi:hypothetical protein
MYNIPEDAEVPNFTSTAWSYDAQGPVTGLITVVIMRRDSHDRLICYQVPNTIQEPATQPIKDVLAPRKYLGVPTNAQLDGGSGRNKILQKLNQRIGIVASRTHNIAEVKLSHNILVCLVATYSPICILMSLQECMQVDKCLLKAYQNCLHFMPCDAKHVRPFGNLKCFNLKLEFLNTKSVCKKSHRALSSVFFSFSLRHPFIFFRIDKVSLFLIGYRAPVAAGGFLVFTSLPRTNFLGRPSLLRSLIFLLFWDCVLPS